MKTKHTPGQWYSQENGRDTYIYREGEGKHTQCMVGKVSKSQNEYEANAKLIAAAPDMLEALNFMVGFRNILEPFLNSNRSEQADGDSPFNVIENAIKKATS